MATRQSDGVGIDHLTVVPENAGLEPAADGELDESADTATEGGAESA